MSRHWDLVNAPWRLLDEYAKVFSEHELTVDAITIDGFWASVDFNELRAYTEGYVCPKCGWSTMTQECWCESFDASGRLYPDVDPNCGAEEYERHCKLQRRDAERFKVALKARVARRIALVRWELVRRAVRARRVVVFWMGEAARSACAVEGDGRRADAAAFAAEFGA